MVKNEKERHNMKIKLFVCFMVMCLFLTGCFPGTKYTGDMDKALNHLKWQDYESAFGEANAFLEKNGAAPIDWQIENL